MNEKKNTGLTPHNAAAAADIAKVVLMPGDPLRSQYIAEHFLEDSKLVNNIRGVQGYTGFYAGKRVTVMASGMGMPSIGIYAYELYHYYPVECILRIGSMGAIQPDLPLRRLVLAVGASTDSAFGKQFGLPGNFAPVADFGLLSAAAEEAATCGIPVSAGNILSSDCFYHDDEKVNEKWAKMGILGVEMETAALYMLAARAGKRALSFLTVSDQLVTKAALSPEERQEGFTDMMQVALRTAARFA